MPAYTRAEFLARGLNDAANVLHLRGFPRLFIAGTGDSSSQKSKGPQAKAATLRQFGPHESCRS